MLYCNFMQSSAMRTQASVLDLQLQMDTLGPSAIAFKSRA